MMKTTYKRIYNKNLQLNCTQKLATIKIKNYKIAAIKININVYSKSIIGTQHA